MSAMSSSESSKTFKQPETDRKSAHYSYTFETDGDKSQDSNEISGLDNAAFATAAHFSEPSTSSAVGHSSVYYQLPFRKEQKLREIYKLLDIDMDGKINISDLTTALERKMPTNPNSGAYAKTIFERASLGNGEITFADFVHYVLQKEKKLEVLFRGLDRNDDGFLDHREIRTYFETLGIPINEEESKRILKKMDTNGSCSIGLDEFCAYLMLYPGTDPKDIAHFWRHTMIDIGEDQLIPQDFSMDEIAKGVWWRHLIAGGCAGSVSRTCTAPLDRLKVYLQVYATRTNNLGVLTGFRYLVQEGGPKALWRGNYVNVLKIAPESALKFMAYEQVKRMIKSHKKQEITTFERLIAGSIAGLFSQSCIYPMEVLKTRLALRKTSELNRGLWDAAKTIYNNNGIRAFYRGYIPNSIGIIPYAGIDLAVYETLKILYCRKHKDITDPGSLVILACGTISSVCGQLASYPLALVRTRLQASIVHPTDANEGMIGQFRYILNNEGFAGLYRGITPNFMKVLPAVSISYVVYESVRKQLGVEMT